MQLRGRRGEVQNAITSSLSTRIENYRLLDEAAFRLNVVAQVLFIVLLLRITLKGP